MPINEFDLFIQEAGDAIAEAHRICGNDIEAAKPAQVVPILKKIATDTEALKSQIAELKAAPRNSDKFDFARMHLKGSLGDHDLTLADVIKILSGLEQAAIGAISDNIKKGRPRGTTGRKVFDIFIERLFTAIKIAGGKCDELKISKMTGKGPRKGSLLDAVELLRPYLPQAKFFPVGDLGRALERITENR